MLERGKDHCRMSPVDKMNVDYPSTNQENNADISTQTKENNGHSTIDERSDEEFSTHLSFMNMVEVRKIIDHLSGMDVNDLRALYDTIYLKLTTRNGYVVDYNPTLTAVLGCHSNALLLGSSEQSKVAAHYVGPYVDKNKTPLSESLEVVYEATEHAKNHPSIAEDTGTNARFVQYVMTRILNQLGSLMEICDTQAAGAVLGLNVSLSSESYTVCDTDACINMIKNEEKSAKELPPINDNKEADSVNSCSTSGSELSSYDSEEDEDIDDFIVPDNNNNANIESNSGGILQSLLNSEEIINECNDNTMLHRIQLTLENADESLESPKQKFFTSAYGSCPIFRVDDGERIVAVPRPFFYRYRGEGLKDINRIEYYSTIEIRKDRPDENDLISPHLQYKKGRKKSVMYRFGTGIEIAANHHQTMRSKLCTPKFFKNTPPHPGQKPQENESNLNAIKQWDKKAKRFAQFYLTAFRPEPELYNANQQTYTYSYEWEDLITFVDELQEKRGKEDDIAIRRFRLDYMTTMIHGLKTSRRNRAIMCDYRARDATRWSEQEQYEARQKYNYRMRKNNIFDEDDIDANLDNQMRMGLGDRMQREIMQKVAFTDGLLNQLKTFTGENSGINKMDYKMDNEDEIKYPVKTGKYNEKLAQNVVEKCPEKEADDEVNDDDAEHDQPTNYTNETCNEKTIDEMVNELITSKHLSQDKLCAIEIMREHFNNVRNGSASDKSYTAPMLLITGSPGTGKSWLIRSITDLSELMELETPVKMAFMGIAAINIDGHTINSFLDVPLEMNKGVGTSKRIKPWDKNKLEAFKQRCDIENLSTIIIDEISMVKPWMLTYIDERLKEARQIYDKPFGGVSIIVLGDFDQQPPIGGSSLPRLAITLLEK